MKKGLTLSKSNKLSFILISLFSIACLRVCAETITMPTEEAKKIRQKLCVESKTYIGCPYVYGAHGPSSFDCSGLIYYIAKKSLKIFLPRTAKGMYDFSDPVSDEDREPGDLVFFQTGSPGIVTHVGIYLGENKFISALSAGPKRGVVISSLTEKYWEKRYLGTRKFLPSGDMKEKTENENLEPSNLEESSEILTQQAQEGQANYSNNSETQEGQAGNSDNAANQQIQWGQASHPAENPQTQEGQASNPSRGTGKQSLNCFKIIKSQIRKNLFKITLPNKKNDCL